MGELSDNTAHSTEGYACYPLNTDDYHRLQRQTSRDRPITQIIVPALCETEIVVMRNYYLSTIPLKRSITSDPDAKYLLGAEDEAERDLLRY